MISDREGNEAEVVGGAGEAAPLKWDSLKGEARERELCAGEKKESPQS